MKNLSKIFVAILPVLTCFALSSAQAVSPAPDGGYPGFNTAEGDQALFLLFGGFANSAFGWRAQFTAVGASNNTSIGAGTLVLNTADDNTAVGTAASLLNSTGTQTVAVGAGAMVNNNADDNTAVGGFALQNNVAAVTNVAVGVFAAQNNDSDASGAADFNVAVGGFALQANVDGTRNTAVGAGAMEAGAAGDDNTAVGELAGLNITGNSNTCLGSNTGSTLLDGEGNIYIGAQVQAGGTGEFEFIRIGNDNAFTFPYDTYIAGIYGRAPSANTLPVVCGDDGKLTANASSRRFKHDIKAMDKDSEAILALKPVSFRYNNDSTNTPWFGLIAEDVAKVNPDLIARDKEGKPFGVRYDQVNAMLLNEFLKEHKKVEALQATVAQQQKGMEVLTTQLKQQAAQIQKVSAQLEMNKPAAKVVVNKP